MADEETTGYEPETSAILAGRNEGETSLAPVFVPHVGVRVRNHRPGS